MAQHEAVIAVLLGGERIFDHLDSAAEFSQASEIAVRRPEPFELDAGARRG